jgi:type IV pilus assembly protein PilO
MDTKLARNIKFNGPLGIGLIVSVAIFLIIIGGYYFLSYSKLEARLSQKKGVLNTVKAKYDADLALVRSYPVLVKQYEALNKEFVSLVLELPSKKDIPGLLMKIADYEKILGLNLKMFKPGKVVARGFYEAVPFSMNISGNFYNVYKFFYKLATMERIVDVHDVSISNGAKGQKVSVSFKGTTFSFIGTPPKKLVKKAGGVVKK